MVTAAIIVIFILLILINFLYYNGHTMLGMFIIWLKKIGTFVGIENFVYYSDPTASWMPTVAHSSLSRRLGMQSASTGEKFSTNDVYSGTVYQGPEQFTNKSIATGTFWDGDM